MGITKLGVIMPIKNTKVLYNYKTTIIIASIIIFSIIIAISSCSKQITHTTDAHPASISDITSEDSFVLVVIYNNNKAIVDYEEFDELYKTYVLDDKEDTSTFSTILATKYGALEIHCYAYEKALSDYVASLRAPGDIISIEKRGCCSCEGIPRCKEPPCPSGNPNHCWSTTVIIIEN